MISMRFMRALALLLLTAFVAACSSGGGSHSSTPPASNTPSTPTIPTDQITGVAPPESVAVVTATNAN
jgi:hypothetical protein